MPVFNLTVADCPEFFAGGVLVHNCFAVMLACWAGECRGPGMSGGIGGPPVGEGSVTENPPDGAFHT